MTDATLANPLLSQNLSSIPAEIDVSAYVNLAEMPEAALTKYADRVAFHCSGRAVTYQNRARTNKADSHSTSV
jgi:long-chain acyl-CoA synthetase